MAIGIFLCSIGLNTYHVPVGTANTGSPIGLLLTLTKAS